MLLAAVHVPLTKCAGLPGAWKSELERSRGLRKLTSYDVLHVGVPERRKRFRSQLWRLLGEVPSVQVVEDDIESDLVRTGILRTDIFSDGGDRGFATLQDEFFRGNVIVTVCGWNLGIWLDQVKSKRWIAYGGA